MDKSQHWSWSSKAYNYLNWYKKSWHFHPTFELLGKENNIAITGLKA